MDVSIITLIAVSVLGSASALILSVRSQQVSRNQFDKYMAYIARLEDRDSSSSDSLTRELVARLNSVNEAARPVVVNVAPVRGENVDFSGTRNNDEAHCGALVREIAHGLNTPLSQIEAATLNLGKRLREELPGVGSDLESDLRSLDRIRASVDLCKSYLGAYREVVNVAATATDWSPASLPNAVKAAARVYSDDMKRISVKLPEKIYGYSNTYILALLLPLLENALEEALGTELVKVEVHMQEAEAGWHVLRVANGTRKTVLDEQVYEAGYTTKPNHQGIGLSAVRRLLATRGGAINHWLADHRVVFELRLPEASSNE